MCLYRFAVLVWMLDANNRRISLALRFFDNRNSLSVMSRLLTAPSRQFIACSRHSSGLTCRGSRLLRVLRARIWRTLRLCFISGATLSSSTRRNCQNNSERRFFFIESPYCQIQASRCNILFIYKSILYRAHLLWRSNENVSKNYLAYAKWFW